MRAELAALKSNPDIEHVSVIAHSFGTYVIGAILKSDTKMTLHRLILCGSVLPDKYDWLVHSSQIDKLADKDLKLQRIVNDCGWRDIWPVFAESITWGYGSAGRFGFQTQNVANRYHPIGHSDFFNAEFIRKYWVPLISQGIVVAGPMDRQMTSQMTQWLRVVKLKWPTGRRPWLPG